MLVRSVVTSYKCGRMLWNTARVDKKFVCINAAMNQSTEARDITDVQAASLKNDMCLLVDERDNIIGTATKRECHRVGPNGMVPLHRAFSVLMFNSAGELLVQKRASQKVTYPNAITNTCCSHPLLIDGVPEDVTTAAIRRLNEELGIPKHQFYRKPEGPYHSLVQVNTPTHAAVLVGQPSPPQRHRRARHDTLLRK
ncbi:hypothetical protein HF086_014158 [Spodoptera exigua]|uniref:isopentenyl-diphosphate Delta-isomerase n=1 Tax=Spodoptera exigua TaxID=7107 RepID=A0A922MMW8_SPOEX|nr:hypothetical protein HF086_014158 [Spodoptera exigua]